MKKLLIVLMSLVLSVGVLAGCGDSSSGGTTDGPRVLTVIPEHVNEWTRNFNAFASGPHQFVSGFVYEPLVAFDGTEQNKEVMWLAEDIISEADNKTITIKLKKDITWSDGEAFNADDVVFTYMYKKDHPAIDTLGYWATDDPKLASVTKIDDYTVEIVTVKENKFNRIDLFNEVWMVPEHIYSEISDPAVYVLEDPVGTGAFTTVKEFTPEMVVMSRNETYWNGETLEVDEMHWPQVNGNDAALALLQTGNVDWSYMLIPDIEKNYVQNDEHRKYWYGMNDGVRVSFNYKTANADNLKAFNDPEFKKAVSLAIDRVGIIDSAIFGYLDKTVPTVTGLPPELRSYVSETAEAITSEYTGFDLEKAKEVLTAGGYVDTDGDGFVENPDGSKIEFEIISPAGWTDWNDGVVIAVEGMREIGINAMAKAVDLGIYMEAWSTGAWDVMYGGYGLNGNIWKFYFDTIGDQSRVLTESWWSTNMNNYTNDYLSALIEEMPTVDDARLNEIVEEIEVFMAENVINIPILYNGKWHVYNDSRFTGWPTEDNYYANPGMVDHDAKLLVLMQLKAVGSE
ncbi:MAG: ABC transporter substrate-binding protein [Erysipelotrichaceae bacterium]